MVALNRSFDPQAVDCQSFTDEMGVRWFSLVQFKRSAGPSSRPSTKWRNPVRRLNETPGLKDSYEEVHIIVPSETDSTAPTRQQVTPCRRLAGATGVLGFSSSATSMFNFVTLKHKDFRLWTRARSLATPSNVKLLLLWLSDFVLSLSARLWR